MYIYSSNINDFTMTYLSLLQV